MSGDFAEMLAASAALSAAGAEYIVVDAHALAATGVGLREAVR